MTCLGALYIRKYVPQIATIFTTHATSIGRSIAGNDKPLYEYLWAYNGIQMSQELNIEAKHSIERQTAHNVDCFTTVSDVTGHECKELLDKKCDVILKNGFGAAIQTKSDRILRDIDLLSEINRSAKCVVQMTLTTWDDGLCQVLEPNVCNTKRRIEVLEEMQKRGIPTVVWLTPILPFINDTEENITSILHECVRVGVKGIIDFGMGLTLREGDREYYYAALDKHFPGMKERYIKRYGNAYDLPSPKARELTEIFQKICKANGILSSPEDCFRFMSELPEKYPQMSIFDL